MGAAACACICALALSIGALGTPLAAYGDEDDSAQTDSAQTEDAQTSADDSGADVIAIDQSTAVVSATSGYHLVATITNRSDQDLPAGTLSVSTNASYTFVSRTDIQDWADGQASIPTPNELGSVQVPALAVGESATVSLDVDSAQTALAAIVTWGPKPLRIAYQPQDGTGEFLHTFLTRSSDGLSMQQTPAMGLTVAMPLTSDQWQVDDETIDGLVSGDADDEAATAVTLGSDDSKAVKAREQAFANHPMLQVVADPSYLNAVQMPPKVAGVTQPGAFDITDYAAYGDADAYTQAGVSTDMWNADAAQSLYREALGDESASAAAYAWQGERDWSAQALNQAAQQGYDTVIASSSFDQSETDTVHTGTYVVHTDAGDVTVLSEQRELGKLAKGQALSETAAAETTDAGLLARFMAQSAFYQMEQPYTSRNLLVTLDANADAEWIEQLMGAVEQASWLTLTDLDTMATADVYDELGMEQVDNGEQAATDALEGTLSTLSATRNDITRLSTAILDDTDDGNADTQNGESTSADEWIAMLLDTHDDMALHALGAADGSAARTRMTEGMQLLSSSLLGAVTITPSESVTVVSESAQMPVTVDNTLPYAVRVRVSSLTDSMQIVTSRLADVTVPANGEEQVTFTIRVSTSGSATATIALQDRDGNAFGATQNTPITSVLRISDMSGFVIIGFAVLLGALGLWRQFHRKKDANA
ncbi:DUF6049 family protein [Bifidobacterium lemurum]|uniref:DUF6049 family protein n=1 Tax=Bifidobacterium lemurum TaxID=1603886 RepID=UPI003522B20A